MIPQCNTFLMGGKTALPETGDKPGSGSIGSFMAGVVS